MILFLAGMMLGTCMGLIVASLLRVIGGIVDYMTEKICRMDG